MVSPAVPGTNRAHEESAVSLPETPITLTRRVRRSVLGVAAAACLSISMTGLVAAGNAPAAGASDLAAAGQVAPAAIAACKGTQLSARIISWEGAMGSRIATVRITNTSFTACKLRDMPRVELVSSKGTVLIKGKAASKTAATHTLGALKSLTTEVSDSNYCGAAPAKPVTLEFILAYTAGRVVSIPMTATDTSGVPPCNGDPGSAGSISMHAWH
jgi:hypothetical protein